jgi:hypothetical protein
MVGHETWVAAAKALLTASFERAMPDPDVHAGTFSARLVEEDVRASGQDANKVETEGRSRIFEVRGPDALRLLVRDTSWDTGARDLAVHDRCDAPPAFDRLASGSRLTVGEAPGGRALVELRQARLKGGNWSNLFKASLEELDAGARTDVVTALRDAGAVEVGTREDVLGDEGRRRSFVVATSPPTAQDVPVVAYVLTRIAPLHHGITA